MLQNTKFSILPDDNNELTLHASGTADNKKKELYDFLKTDNRVKHVDLSNNNLSNEGALMIAKILEINTSWLSLNLSNNDIGPVGAKAVADALKKNQYLENLFLDQNPKRMR